MSTHFPTPSVEALQHSQQLTQLLIQDIQQHGGSVPFSHFMHRCLYAPGLGYYSAGSSKFGVEGDFVTAPELGHLFSATVANAIQPVLAELGENAMIVELGGGTGAMARDILLQLEKLATLPSHYAILEPSADLQQRQQQLLKAELPAYLFSRLMWLNAPINTAWKGVLLANEVIDALSSSRFVIQSGEVYEQTVGLNSQQQFCYQQQPADFLLSGYVRHIEKYLETPFSDGYISEALPQLPYWIQAVIGGLEQGALLFIDYGYSRKEYYLPERHQGTLRAFYRHQMHTDVFAWPGLQDITASVDFTAVAEAGLHAGFELSGYTSQASFLLGNQFETVLQHAELHADAIQQNKLRQQAKQLILPSEMGERFQVIGLARGVNFDAAFSYSDLSWRL